MKEKMKIITIRLSEKLYKKLCNKAKEQYTSQQSIIRQIIAKI